MSHFNKKYFLLQTELIVREYIIYRIQSINGHVPSHILESLQLDGIASPTAVSPNTLNAIKELASEFERRYRGSYQSQFSELTAPSSVNFDSSDAKISFTSVADELFIDGWRWARVVALISYVGLLAKTTATSAKAVLPDKFLSDRLNEIVDWTLQYFQCDRGVEFFRSVDGWEGFSEWCGQSDANTLLSADTFPKQVALVGLTAAAMVGLSFMVGRIIQ